MSDSKTRRALREVSKAAESAAVSADISPIALAAAENAGPAIEHVAEAARQTIGENLAKAAELTTPPVEPPAPAVSPEEAVKEAAASVAEKAEQESEKLFSAGQDTMAAFAESQAAIVRGLEAMVGEVSGLARLNFAAAADTATALLGVKTWADAIEVQAGLARRSVDAAIEGSAKLSEIGVRLTTEASRPLLSCIGEPWKVFRAG